MRTQYDLTSPNDRTLTSTAGAPFSFSVSIQTDTKNQSRLFSVSGPDPATGSTLTREYHLARMDQNAYLDLFERLAEDFGTRLPSNRRPPAVPRSTTSYQALLTENLSPDILYGYGDPALIQVTDKAHTEQPDWYYLVVTSNDAPNSFPIARSRNLTEWELVGFVFPEGHKPAWAAEGQDISDYWAPEMHYVAGEFLVCFAAREKDRSLSIGIAKSSHPEGPFFAPSQPLLRGGVIDPHILIDHGGTCFLFWKEDTNDVWPSRLSELLYEHDTLLRELFLSIEDQRTASFTQALWPWVSTLEPMERFFVQQVLIETVISDFAEFRRRLVDLQRREIDPNVQDAADAVLESMRTIIYAQELAADGSRLMGERTAVLENDRDWEGHLVEGQWVTEHHGKYYMFYSGNDFSTAQYGVGAAIADSPLGPYRKSEEPLLQSTKEWSGPGHPSVAKDPDGWTRLFLHGFFPGSTGYKAFRALLSVPITLKDDHVVPG